MNRRGGGATGATGATGASGVVVRCRGVEKVYSTVSGDVHALRAVDADIAAETVSAVVGPSGSGKSTLLRIIGCLDRPSGGTVDMDGVVVSRLPARGRRRVRRAVVGYVFQSPERNLLPYLSAIEHLRFAAQLRGQPGGNEAGMLDLLGLVDRRSSRPAQLSGGEQQRLAFGMAVIGSPRLVVADEPTAELDSDSAGELIRLLAALRDRGATMVLSSHDPLVVNAADHVVRLSHGQVV